MTLRDTFGGMGAALIAAASAEIAVAVVILFLAAALSGMLR